MTKREMILDKLIGIVWENSLSYEVCDRVDFHEIYGDEEWYNEDDSDRLYQEFLELGDRFINRDMTDDEMIEFLDKYIR